MIDLCNYGLGTLGKKTSSEVNTHWLTQKMNIIEQNDHLELCCNTLLLGNQR